MKDLIEERDRKEKMQSSIVKWWNVHYMTPEELEAERAKEAASAPKQEAHDLHSEPANAQAVAEGSGEAPFREPETAQDIIDRLHREAEADEARKREEIEEVKRAAEANFNGATGAYSGGYGSDGADEIHQAQIDAILAEKDDALRDLIERTGED